jgi:DIS3-like exonuclease 2
MKGVDLVPLSPIDRTTEVVDSKDKKKKRSRSNRKNKQISSVPVCRTVSEVSVETPDVAFISLPSMHVNERMLQQEFENSQNHQMILAENGGKVLLDELQKSNVCDASLISNSKRDNPLLHRSPCNLKKKHFATHWTTDSVTEALEKGVIFKSLFHVNAHNRLEAYCKIDGVPVDVLINGLSSQNRAIEGDVVAIKIDPLSLWTRMRGSAGNSTNVSTANNDSDLVIGAAESVPDNCKGKNKLDVDCDYSNHMNGTYSYQNGNICDKSLGDSSSSTGSSSQDQTAVEKLCEMINSFPSKRPNGKVVSIIDKSPRRDKVLGFLRASRWVSNQESAKKNKLSLSKSNLDHIPLNSTDPKFPEVMVPIRSLPDSMKKRLYDLDPTVEMDLVSAKIVDWGEESEVPEAQVTNIFGRGGEVEPQIAAILHEQCIEICDFSTETMSCVPREVPKDEFRNRKDLRDLCVFTIDPATATDLDDALSVVQLQNGIYRVGIHIADVSFYVLPGTPIDKEAQTRSTSVYLTHSKLPMLPPAFSEGLGSLDPGEDRLTFSIFWDISPSGEILDRWIGRTVIRSCCQLTYEVAQEIIDDTIGGDFPHLHGRFKRSDVIKSVKILHKISETLKGNRFANGALSFENPKIYFVFGEDGIPYDTVLSSRKDSNFLIEEFMLLANCTAAEVITRAYPSNALLRNHPRPDLPRLRNFEAFGSKLGLNLDTSSSGPLHHSLQRAKQEFQDDPVLFEILMCYATRSMPFASYFSSGDPFIPEHEWSHYALAVPLYTHFTSPLRRYPDIIVHRTLAAALEAEEAYLKMNGNRKRCFTGLEFDKDAVNSDDVLNSIKAVSFKHKIMESDELASVTAYCNLRKKTSRHAKDDTDKFYMWLLVRKKEILFSEARVLGLGPKFMSIYIQKLNVEQRIYYDEVEGLIAEWLESTSTLILSLCTTHKRFKKRTSAFRPIDEVALLTSPSDNNISDLSETKIEPSVFPLTLKLFSSIPVALHAYGGDGRSLGIGARLYATSYYF